MTSWARFAKTVVVIADTDPKTLHYKIARSVADREGGVPLSREEYLAILEAKRCILAILDIESKFEILAASYEEWEHALLLLTLRSSLYHQDEWREFQHDRLQIERRLLSVLAAAQTYAEQIGKDVTRLYGGKSPVLAIVEDEEKEQSRQRFGFRVMQAARNHALHVGHLVHNLSYPNRWDGEPWDPKSGRLSSIAPSLRADVFEAGRFVRGADAGLVDEMKRRSGRYGLPIRPLVREFVEGLAVVRERFNEASADDDKRWNATIAEALRRGAEAFNGAPDAVVVTESKPNVWPERTYLSAEPSAFVGELRRKNRWLMYVSRAYVVSHDREE
jgi:hypothetical protein